MGAGVRLPGWESRLADIIETYRDLPYQLGRCDCFTLSCAVFAALRGVDHWPRIAGRYSTWREAVELIAEHGSTFDAAAVSFADVQRIPIVSAQRGDLVFYRDAGGVHLTVCLGSVVAAYGPEGLVFLPISEPRLGPALRV